MELKELTDIMTRLRATCPWDKKQTHESLKPYLIEEAYELIEAIDEGSPQMMREELGDLLLQIVFHSELARERGEFSMAEVIEGIATKMVTRHPHVFGEASFESAEEVLLQWEQRKKEEGKMRESILEGVPKAMPALLRARRLQGRASKVGFDWSRVEDVMGKVDEELDEFRQALASGNQEQVEEELGDLFFTLVNVSRFVSVDPEAALHKTISKFISRFRHIEMHAAARGVELKDMSLEEMDKLWDEQRSQGGKGSG